MNVTKKYIFAFLLFSSCSLLYSQNLKPKWGPQHKTEKGLAQYGKLLHFDGNQYYYIQHHEKYSDLYIFNVNHELNSLKKLEFQYNNKKVVLDEIIDVEDKALIVLTQYHKKEGKFRYFISELNKGSLGELKMIYEMDYEAPAIIARHSGWRDNDFTGVIVSPNEKHIGLIQSTNLSDLDPSQGVKLVLLNSSFEVLREAKHVFKKQDIKIDAQNAIVTDGGQIHLLLSVQGTFKEDKEVTSIGPEHKKGSFRVLSLNETGVSLNLIFGEKEESIQAAELISSASGSNEVVVTGFYRNKEKNFGIQGAFFNVYDASFNPLKSKWLDFPESFRSEFLSEKQLKKNLDIGELSVYRFSTYLSSDNNYCIVARSKKLPTMTSNGPGKAKGKGIIIMQFGMDGNLIDLQGIRRSSSYYLTPREIDASIGYFKDKMYIYFFDKKGKDSLKKAKERNKKIQNTSRITDLAVYDISNQKLIRKEFQNVGQLGEPLHIASESEFFGNKLLLMKAHGKKISFGTVEMK